MRRLSTIATSLARANLSAMRKRSSGAATLGASDAWRPVGPALASSSTQRALSTSSPSRDNGNLSQEQQDHVRRLAANVQKNVKEGEQAMRDEFGGEHAEKRWMLDFYQHKQHRYLVPAAATFLSDEKVVNMPTIASKTAFFFALALRKGVPQDKLTTYVSTLPFVCEDQGLLFAILRHANIPQARELFDKMAASVRRKGERGLLEAGQHVGSVPLVPAETWPLPFANDDLEKSWQTMTQPFELAPCWRPAKDVLTFQQYMLLGSTTILECLWAGFYATGDKRYIHRVIDVASYWSEFAAELPDQVQYLTNIQAPLPSTLTAESDVLQYQQKSVRAQASRAACWSLLSNARRHEAVTHALCESLAALSPHMLAEAKEEDDSASAAPSKAAESEDAVVVEGENASNDQELPPAPVKLTPAQVKQRLEVLPALLHLLGRMVLDSPPVPAAKK